MGKSMKNIFKLTSYIKSIFTWKTMCGRIILISIISVIISLILSTVIYTRFINNLLVQKVGQELLDNLNDKTNIMDNYLNYISDNASKFSLNEELYKLFMDVPENPSEVYFYNADKIITQSLLQHFTNKSDVYAAYLVTDNFIYGHMQLYQTISMLKKSDLYQKVSYSNGECVWIPTFNYKDLFSKSPAMISAAYDIRLFALAKKVRFVSINDIKTKPGENELPVLVLYFKDDFYNKFFTTGDKKLSDAWILDGQTVIFNSNSNNMPLSLEEVNHLSGNSGMYITKDRKMLVAYSKSNITGWISITIKSISDMMKETYKILNIMVVITVFLALIISTIVLIIVRKMLSPLKDVSNAIVQSGEGNFKLLLDQKGPQELVSLINAYNNMNIKINNLMEEIYKTRLSETRTKLLSLQLEMEPHFLYNTLNAINWLAVDKEEEKISEMLTTLANMLRYVLSQENEVVELEKEMEWLNSYIKIIKLRFGEGINFVFDIDKRLMATTVPVMMLQPFIENAIVHGINGHVKNGEVRIIGRWKINRRIFIVQDNGKGMTSEDIIDIWNKTPMQIGIKNVDMRVKLIYGESYGVTIQSEPGNTKVTINIA